MNAARHIMVGVSGGVDSSVAALLIRNAGYRAVGITMKLWSPGDQDAASAEACETEGGEKTCCTADSAMDAKRVCDQIGIPIRQNSQHTGTTVFVRRQRDFLDHGVEHLKPMMLKDVAEDIGMHLSTISRVVNRKYAHTPQGVLELRRFFSEGMLNEEGEEVSTRILKLRIKKWSRTRIRKIL